MKIKELILFTANLEKQKDLYGGVLNFESCDEEEDAVCFKTGRSRLKFVRDVHSNPVHFALIIPGDSYIQANTWLKQRVTLLPFEGEEIIDFPNWNARSQYFYDADRNIVEFIARRDVEASWKTPFGPDAIVQIGEVGLPHSNLEDLYMELNAMRPLSRYSGDFRRFAAAGDPEGLFILANPDEKDWFPNNDKVLSAHLIVKGDYNFEYKNETLKQIQSHI